MGLHQHRIVILRMMKYLQKYSKDSSMRPMEEHQAQPLRKIGAPLPSRKKKAWVRKIECWKILTLLPHSICQHLILLKKTLFLNRFLNLLRELNSQKGIKLRWRLRMILQRRSIMSTERLWNHHKFKRSMISLTLFR